jgi:hypothetical protein
MGRSLKVKYYPNELLGVVSLRHDIQDYNLDNCGPNELIEYALYLDSMNKIVEFSGNYTANINLGPYNYFYGSRKELEEKIKYLINKKHFSDYTTYTAIGNLSLILGECPRDYDFVIVEND